MIAPVVGISDANRRWWTLAGTCMGLFVLMLDSTVINVALPDIARDLDATTAGLQWVMNGYLLVLAAFVVSAGRLGDVLGRRRVFVVGMVVFAAGSAVAATSDTEEVLVAGRVLQGLGGAALLGLSLAIVSAVFGDDERARALGIWAGVSALALGLGPLVGGGLVEAVSWRWLFWLNLPFCLLGLVLVLRSTAEQRDETAPRRIDLPGVITVGGGLAAIVIALVEGKVWGWTSAATIGVFALGLGLLTAFWFIEHRVKWPIVEFDLFRNGPYFGASAAGFCLVGCYWALMFLQPQYLQTDLRHSALEAGLLILPVTAPMIAISPMGGRLIARFGVRALMTFGMALGTAGLVVLAQVDESSGYGLLFPGYLLFGIALGFVYAPMSTAAMTAMPTAKAGIAAGVLAMNRVLAGAITLAAAGAVFQAVFDEDDAFAPALSGATWLLVGLCAVGTVLTWAFVRSADDTAVAPEHQAHRHFHLPWLARSVSSPAGVDFYDLELRAHHEHLRAAYAIRAGDEVLDIGCGTGLTTREAGRAAAPGRVVGVDVSERMLERARELTAAEGLENVSYELGDVQVHRFEAAGFDVAISRFGTMFFSDPAAAFANVAAALRPEARLVMLVWQGRERNEWELSIQAALGDAGQPPPPGGDPFSLGDAEATERLLEEAGFEGIRFEDVHEPVLYGHDLDTALAFVRGFQSTSAALARLSDGEASQAVERLRDMLAAHHSDERGVVLDARSWLVTARRRGS